MTGLTHQQARCLGAIQRLTVDGVAPSYDELVPAIGLSSRGAAHRLVTQLVERGFVRRLPGRARALEVVHTPDPATEIARLAGLYAHEVGDQAAASTLRRIADRLEHKPREGRA